MPSPAKTYKKFVHREFSDEFYLFLVFLFIVVMAGIFVPRFFTFYNILSVVRQFSLITIVAIGGAVVLISGAFDLSVGAIAGMAGILAAHLMVTYSWPVWASILLGVLVGVLAGVFNGLLVTKIKIQPLITTLASSWIFKGVILITTQGWPVTKLPESFQAIGQGQTWRIPNPIIIMVVIGILVSVFLSQTVYGRFLYALGGNERASRLAGLNVDRLRILAFVFSGALAALAGILLAARMGSAQADGGASWPLPSIAAAVIGGVSLSGGKGKIYGVMLGAALLGIINNILVLLHISSYWQDLISGFIVLVAVSIDSSRKHRASLQKAAIIKKEEIVVQPASR